MTFYNTQDSQEGSLRAAQYCSLLIDCIEGVIGLAPAGLAPGTNPNPSDYTRLAGLAVSGQGQLVCDADNLGVLYIILSSLLSRAGRPEDRAEAERALRRGVAMRCATLGPPRAKPDTSTS
jgi:hypothetical protein